MQTQRLVLRKMQKAEDKGTLDVLDLTNIDLTIEWLSVIGRSPHVLNVSPQEPSAPASAPMKMTPKFPEASSSISSPRLQQWKAN